MTGDAVPVFASGMCKDCFVHFVRATGGVHSKGANPPAYIRGLEKDQALVTTSNLRTS